MIEGIFLLLGSNLGDRLLNISQAIDNIEQEIGNIINQSSIYKTAPWGKTDQPSFYNQVVQTSTLLPPSQLLDKIISIENKIGRKRLKKWGERIIDIDILYYNQIIFNTQELSIPHPEIKNRLFTLIPLCEIASDFIHPVLNVTQQQLLEQCNDQLEVIKLDTSYF